jgi:predicted alpha/beta-hydrolase family hydrolase
MLGLMNGIAGMWKEAGVASLRYDPSIYMERRKKNTKGPGKDSRPSGQDFGLETSKRAAEFLFTDSDWK